MDFHLFPIFLSSCQALDPLTFLSPTGTALIGLRESSSTRLADSIRPQSRQPIAEIWTENCCIILATTNQRMIWRTAFIGICYRIARYCVYGRFWTNKPFRPFLAMQPFKQMFVLERWKIYFQLYRAGVYIHITWPFLLLINCCVKYESRPSPLATCPGLVAMPPSLSRLDTVPPGISLTGGEWMPHRPTPTV